MTYQTWLNDWLTHYVKLSTKTRTHQRYQQICNLHIIPILGTYELDDITTLLLQQFVTTLLTSGNLKTGKGLSANFVNSVISVMQSSLKTAYAIGLSKAYIASKIKRPRSQEKQVECFSVQEQKIIEHHVLTTKKDKLAGIVLCLYTGLRIGELLALRWDDLDCKACLLSVTKTCYDGYVNGKRTRILDTPKTSTSQRIIPFPKQLLPFLKKLRHRSQSEWLVADGSNPIFVRSYQRTFELVLKKLGIPHKGFHALRHTFATRALECGMDVKTLSELLGHKNPTVTLTRYAHSLIDHKKHMMNQLGKLF